MNKKKLTVNRLAMGNLKARKKQYTLMIIGIVLAMIFSSGVMFFVFSALSSFNELDKLSFGNQDAVLMNAQYYNFDRAIENDLIDDYSIAHAIGYGYNEETGEESGSLMAWYDEDAYELSYVGLREGRYPEKAGEIAFERDALVRMKLNAQIGDKITLTVKTPKSENYLSETVEKTYTLVGILHDKRSNIESEFSLNVDQFEYPAIMLSPEEKIEKGGKERLVAFIDYAGKNDFNTQWHITQAILSEMEERGLVDNEAVNGTIPPSKIIYSNAGKHFSTQSIQNTEENIRMTTILAVVLTTVLLLASCVGIVNAFNSNLQERRKQIGMLRAVGATKQQIVKVFGREAMIISLCATPLSLLISYFAVKFIIGFMGEGFVFIPEWWVLIVCGLFGIICVMAAALIPLIRASAVSPMQAIRNIDYSRKMKNKRVKSQTKFNAPNLIASRNLMFRKGRQIGVSFILVATIIISGFGFAFIENEAERMNSFYNDFDYAFESSGGTVGSNIFNCKWGVNYSDFSESVKQEILSLPYVKTVGGIKTCMANIVFDGEISDYMRLISMYYGNTYELSYERSNINTYEEYVNQLTKSKNKRYLAFSNEVFGGKDFYSSEIHSFEPSDIEEIEKYVTDGKINIDKLDSGEEIILFAPQKIGYRFEPYENGEGFSGGVIDISDGIKEDDAPYIGETAELSYKAGDVVNISVLSSDITPQEMTDDVIIPDDIKANNKQVKIGAIVSSIPQNSRWVQEMNFLTTNSGMNHFYENHPYLNMYITLKNDCTEEVDGEMTYILNQYTSGNGYRIYSKFQSNQEKRNTIIALYIIIISVVVLFFSTAASIINNSLTAQIRESKREIGTLRAVGASARELTQSYFRQLLSMFGWGCGAGFGLYTFIWILMYFAAKSTDMSFDYKYQIWQAALICIALLAVCFVNLYSKVKKQMKYSIVENIREL